MTKAAVISELREKHDLSKVDAEVALESVVGAIRGVVERGDTVRLPGFGTFAMKHSKARSGRNPATGETVAIPARSAIGFKAAKKA